MSFVFEDRIGVSLLFFQLEERTVHVCGSSQQIVLLFPLSIQYFHIQIMGRGRNWSAHERECASVAWLTAMNTKAVWLKPTDQYFKNHLHHVLQTISPTDDPRGRYAGRNVSSIYDFLRGHILPDVSDFVHKSLQCVLNSNPVNVTEDQVISMAIAIHLQKTDRMDYTFKNHDHYQWKNYRAWKVLREHPNFRSPPVQPMPEQNIGAKSAAANPASPSPTISLRNIMNGVVPEAEASPVLPSSSDVDQDEWSCDDSSLSVESDDDKSMMDILFKALKQSTKNWNCMAQMMELDMILDMALEFPDNPTFARAAERKLLEFCRNDYGDDLRPNKKFKADIKSSNHN
jgi:hypothetical protein